MKILIVEDDPQLIRLYTRFFGKLMPEARLDIAVSVGGYIRVSDTRYDAYIMDETIDGGKSAFEHIVPRLQARFPGAFILHNGSDSDPDNISQQERMHRIRFARGPDGHVIACGKNIAIAIEAIRALAVPKEALMQKPAGRIPFCQSMRADAEPRPCFRCCRA